jgi:enoyl-CoA hydratase/carnithine racemase
MRAVTHSSVQDVELPAAEGHTSPGVLALITLDNGLGPSKPTTLGPNTLVKLGTVLERLRERAAAGEIAAVAVTGKPNFFVAGADLSAVTKLQEREHGLWMAQLGHEVYSTLANLGVPSFAFINGVALGGGLEIALQSTYRTVSTRAAALALPEAFLGLVPGWGGVYLLPRLIGPENAVKVMIDNALNNNRSLSGPEAFKLGIADALFEAENFLEQSVAWAARVVADAAGSDSGGSGTAPERPRRRRSRRPRCCRTLGGRRGRRPRLRRNQNIQCLPGAGRGAEHPGGQPNHDPGGVRRARMRNAGRPHADQ